jgi:ketosteroid isomerase-like protein
MGVDVTNEESVRKYYAAWEKKDWTPFETLLAESFTFTSANDDDHISKSDFKTQCWRSQIDFIQRFELQCVIAKGDDAFVKYLCHTKNGRSFRNVEYFRCIEGKVEAIESYFGARSSFPSAARKGIMSDRITAEMAAKFITGFRIYDRRANCQRQHRRNACTPSSRPWFL